MSDVTINIGGMDTKDASFTLATFTLTASLLKQLVEQKIFTKDQVRLVFQYAADTLTITTEREDQSERERDAAKRAAAFLSDLASGISEGDPET